MSRTITSALAVSLIATLVASTPVAAGNVDLPRFPSISPDASEIVFSWRGDLWKVAATGGQAMRLTVHPAAEQRSAWSADGSTIVFESNRDGYGNIYAMNADGTNVRQVTNTDATCVLSGFGTDGEGNEVVLFDSNREFDLYRSNRPYMIGSGGGDMTRLHDAFGSAPRVSPDGNRVVFSRNGFYYGWERRHGRGPETQDLWVFDRTNDSFRALTTRRGNDGYGKWIDDRTLVYMSDREGGAVNLYTMDVGRDEASARRITDFGDLDVVWFDVSADGSTAIAHVWDSLYTIGLTGQGVQIVQLDITANEDESDNYEIKDVSRLASEAALSPDGEVMAFIAYGEVYVRNVEDGSTTRRVTNSHSRERDIAWSPDGLKVYFTSDRDGTESIYAATVTLTRGELKEEFESITNPEEEEEEVEEEDAEEDAEEADDGEDEDDTEDADAAPAADDGISGTWSGSVNVPQAGEMPFTLELSFDPADNSISGTATAPQGTASVSGTFDPDSGEVSLTVSGEDGSTTELNATVTGNSMSGTGTDGEITFDFNAERTAIAQAAGDDDEGDDAKDDEDDEDEELPKELDPKRWHDAMRFVISPVIQTEHNDREVSPSPDGTSLAFRRGRGDIVIRDLESGDEHVLAEGWDFGVEARWSPDSRYIAYAQSDMDFNTDIFIVPADGSAERVNITRHPDNEGNPRWSADGKILAFLSERVNDEFDVWMVYLDPSLEALTPKELETYYDDAVKAAKKRKPLSTKPEKKDDDEDDDEADEADEDDEGDDEDEDEDADDDDDEGEETDEEGIDADWDLEGAYLRLRRVTTWTGGEFNLELTPGGDRYIFTGNDGTFGLFSLKWDRTDKKRLGGGASVQHMSLTGDKLVVVSGGRGGTVKPGGGGIEFVGLDDDIRIDLQAQAQQKFNEMARGMGELFYHPTMKGLDWDALTERYGTLASQTRTAGEFNHVSNRMLGELTGSHLGVRSATGGFNSANRQAHGRLGARTQREGDGYRVTDLIAESPGAKGPMALHIGDFVTGIELEGFEGSRTLEAALEGRAGEETIVTIQRVMTDEEGNDAPVELNLLITPGSFGQMRGLAYNDWRTRTAKQVAEMSGGRIGYIHVQGMNQQSLDVFERDLFAAADGKDGLIIDVRNNGGGWTADRLLASIMVQPHAYTIPRGSDPEDIGHYPRDRLFIQRYNLPINMLCNEKSFSNAEIVSHAFKQLERGTLVGQETWGGVISTGAFFLIDGSSVRLPFRGWYVMDGSDMENKGAMPDIVVDQTPVAEAAGADEQLEAAVNDLLGRLD